MAFIWIGVFAIIAIVWWTAAVNRKHHRGMSDRSLGGSANYGYFYGGDTGGHSGWGGWSGWGGDAGGGAGGGCGDGAGGGAGGGGDGGGGC